MKAENRESVLGKLSLGGEVQLPEGFRSSYVVKGRLERSLIEEISRAKKEPEWMLRLRLKALEAYEKLPFPNWIRGVEELDIDELAHYIKPEAGLARSWEDIPQEIRRVYEGLNLPEAEKRALAGISFQFESETVYLGIKKLLEERKVVMVPMEEALNRYPDMVKEYFSRVFPFAEHKFAALHAALWSGGVFVYVPRGIRIPQPIEAFFFMASALEGQFEHTLLIADEGSEIQFIEGCSAPMYKSYSFHDGMVEIYAHRNSRVKFVTLQNWSGNVINFNNKRAIAESNSSVEWLEGSVGSKVTYVYPSTILKGDGAKTSIYTVTISNGKKLKDTGAKVIALGKNAGAKIVSKSISANGGTNVYRGLVRINRGSENTVVTSSCDSLILDRKSRAYTYPHNQIEEDTASVSHEARTGRISEEQLFYMRSRGLSEGEAKSLMVLGFLEDVLVDVPFEMASVLNTVIQLEFSKLGGTG
ncbi:MAG: Fe-S cluster assembly protein SufB [Fervidicoccaceae archaeon]